VKETFNACFRLVFAACAVRTFAFVALSIPIYPAKERNSSDQKMQPAIIGELCSTAIPLHANNIPA